MTLISPIVDIAAISIALAIVSQVLRRKVLDQKEMKRKQKEIKKKQEKIKELMQKNDHKAKNEIDALQAEMMESMNAMMKGSMKLMMYSMILFLPAYWFLGSAYGNAIVPLPIPIPWLGAESFIEFYSETSWLGWYILTSLVFSLSLNGAIGIYEKLKGGENADSQ